MLKVIYTSDHLRKSRATSCVATSIDDALKQCGVEHKELTNTKDYWCRDYMPLFTGLYYMGFKYDPDYLREKGLEDYKTNQEDAFKEIERSECFRHRNYPIRKTNIILDGGNFVNCETKFIMTDKVFMENPYCHHRNLLNALGYYLGLSPIIIPWDMEEETGHADGMVANLYDGKILLNNFKQLLTKRSLPYYRRLIKILEPHFDIVELEYDCKVDKYSWCYLNYLELDNAILLPTLSQNSDSDNDLAAIELFRKIFPRKRVIPIYSLPIIKRGGGLHCVTWDCYTFVNGLCDRR